MGGSERGGRTSSEEPKGSAVDDVPGSKASCVPANCMSATRRQENDVLTSNPAELSGLRSTL